MRILTLSHSPFSHIDDNVYYFASAGIGKLYPEARVQVLWNRRMMTELVEWCPDVVHSQCEFSTLPPAFLMSKRCNAPLIHTYHTLYEDYAHYIFHRLKMGKTVARKYSELILNHIDHVIVPSRKIETMLSKHDIHSDVRVIPSGISLERFAGDSVAERTEVRSKLGIPEDEFVMLFLGRLAKEKNMDEILDMLAGLKDKTQRLVVAGYGPYKAALERKASELGIRDRVIFTGMIDPSEVPKYYKAADVFVNASKSETQGLTYVEAMACGLPILAKKDQCLGELIEPRKNGFIFESAEEFEGLLCMLKSNPNLRKVIGVRAGDTIEKRYSANAFAKSILAFYEYCVNESNLASLSL